MFSNAVFSLLFSCLHLPHLFFRASLHILFLLFYKHMLVSLQTHIFKLTLLPLFLLPSSLLALFPSYFSPHLLLPPPPLLISVTCLSLLQTDSLKHSSHFSSPASSSLNSSSLHLRQRLLSLTLPPPPPLLTPSQPPPYIYNHLHLKLQSVLLGTPRAPPVRLAVFGGHSLLIGIDCHAGDLAWQIDPQVGL